MIKGLRGQKYSKSGVFRRYYYERTFHRCWTDEQIREALGLTPARFEKCVKAWAENGHPGRPWDRHKIERAFTDFVHKEKRWPTWSDGRNWRQTGLPFWETIPVHGMNVWGLIETYCQKHQRRLTPQMVFSIPNLTTRRNVIERIGIDNLIRKGGGEAIQQDDYGTLWRLPTDGPDPHMQYVEVVNTTPQMTPVLDKRGEPRVNKNGEVAMEYAVDKKGNFIYDHYFLRVPPTCNTAKDAVAWMSQVPALEFAGFAAES